MVQLDSLLAPTSLPPEAGNPSAGRPVRCFPFPCRRLPAALILFLAVQPGLQAEKVPLSEDFEVPGVSYSQEIPPPEAVLGHQIGTRHTRPDQVVEYFEAVAARSPRVRTGRHGKTYEGRTLIHAVVTSEANQARLEEIRLRNLALSDSPHSISDRELEQMPVVVSMGYSIHGNEASGTEAALLLLYHLAAGSGPELEAMLDQLVILIDPMLNPDGRARFVNWVNANRGGAATSDPQDREHNEPWPGGRTNHYWFDLNRDWLPVQHPETRGRVELFYHWRPQLVTDFHEMGSESTYFFQPGVPTRNHPLIPEQVHELTRELARYHARAMDRIGSLYYTRETYDDFYFGKGSTYPDINGAVGILFEQASSRALSRETRGGVLTYGFTIRNHFATSLSSLEGARHLRSRLLRHQRDFYRDASRLARQSPIRAYLLSLEGDRTRAQLLAQTLQTHRIRLHALRNAVTLEGHSFQPGQAYLIPVDQPQVRLLQTLMERRTEFEDPIFYDISTWTFPLAYGVSVKPLQEDPGSRLGEEAPEVVLDGGVLEGGESTYAYLVPWNRYFAPRFLFRLLEGGVPVRVLRRPLEVEREGGSRHFPRGSLIIPVHSPGLDPGKVHELVRQGVAEEHVQAVSFSSGLNLSGPDLGSPSTSVLTLPRIALLTGAGTTAYEAGEAWYLLAERMRIPVSLLDTERFSRTELGRYNTLILPGGSYSELPSAAVESIRQWVQKGGLLIALKTGARWVIEKQLVAEKLRETEEVRPEGSYEEVLPAREAQAVAGAIFEAALDETHPVAFGFGKTIPWFRNYEVFYEPSSQPGATVARYSESPHLSGYVSAERLEQLKGSAAILARRLGEGGVILFADNPNFRGFWLATQGLFLNAVFFGSIF